MVYEYIMLFKNSKILFLTNPEEEIAKVMLIKIKPMFSEALS